MCIWMYIYIYSMECVRVCVYMTERKKAKFSDFPYNRCGNIHWRTQPAQLSSSANTQVLPIFPLGKNSQIFIPGPCRKKAWLTAVSHSHLLWPKSLKSSTTLAFPAYLPYHPLAMLSFLLSNTSRTLLDPSIARQRNCINLVVVSWRHRRTSLNLEDPGIEAQWGMKNHDISATYSHRVQF